MVTIIALKNLSITGTTLEHTYLGPFVWGICSVIYLYVCTIKTLGNI